MKATDDPIVPIPTFEDLSPAFQERARRGRERLGVNVNSLFAFGHSQPLGGAMRDYFEAAARPTVLPNDSRLLIRLAAATANQCRYRTAHQRHQMQALFRREREQVAVGDVVVTPAAGPAPHVVIATEVCARLILREAFPELFEFLVEGQRDPGGTAAGSVIGDFDVGGMADDAARIERRKLDRDATSEMPNATPAG
jgi:alkylhydroperoxidase/carboxymuconolactone decarboxylase family protein YurZ